MPRSPRKSVTLERLPSDLQDVIGSMVGYPGRWRQTAHGFRFVKGNHEHALLEGTGDLHSKCLYRIDNAALVKRQLAHAIKHKYVELSLNSRKGEACLETFHAIQAALTWVCRTVRVLRLNTLGPEPTFRESVLRKLFGELLPVNNTIRELQIVSNDVNDVSKILRTYPTKDSIKYLIVLVPKALARLGPNETLSSPAWLPNKVRDRVMRTLVNKPGYTRLDFVRILSFDGKVVEVLKNEHGGAFDYKFGLERENGIIVDLA